MITLTKRELIEMVYRPQPDLPVGFIDNIMNITNEELVEMASKSMQIIIEYIGAGLFITKY